MLNGLYGYIFGSASTDSSVGYEVNPTQNHQPVTSKKVGSKSQEEAGEWIMVDGDPTPKSKSSTAVPPPTHLLDECKSLSSTCNSMTTSWSEAEASAAATAVAPHTANGPADNSRALKQQQKMASVALQQQRQWLTKMLFADPDPNKAPAVQADSNHDSPQLANGNPNSDKKLKRASKAEIVQSQAKTKQRSKKSAGAKFNANRNNDRKCNPHNLD